MIRNLYLVLALCLFFPAGLFAQVDTLQTVVYFDVGQSTLRADARVRLDALLQRRGEADWVRVEFTGRTDHDGDLAANLPSSRYWRIPGKRGGRPLG
jgi:outer membrane protein OmpA-like peptidoglycan-associated protein